MQTLEGLYTAALAPHVNSTSSTRRHTQRREQEKERERERGRTQNTMGAKTAVETARREPDDMKRLAVSYMGWPLHFIASLLWVLMSEFLAIVSRRKKEQTQAKLVSSPTMMPQPLVRLKNLPQVSERRTWTTRVVGDTLKAPSCVRVTILLV